MIVTRRGGMLHLVEQIEHGRVAGELAAAWGNDVFEVPAPRDPVVFAAAHHDEGWRAWDRRPLFNEPERRPAHFLEIDVTEHVTLYRQGRDRVGLADGYAGVLVGMHWTGLYRGRWSAPGARGRLGLGEADLRLQDAVVDAEEHRGIADRRRAWTGGTRGDFEAGLWHNHALLQLWDLLSLYLAVMPQDPGPADGPAPQLWGPQLARLEHDPQDVLLPPVRTGPHGGLRQLEVTVREPGVLTLHPYPLSRDGVQIQVFGTALADRPWASQDAAERVRCTPTRPTTWRIEPRRTS